MARHLLVTNDFPPKVGGIQTYLWELWRRLPAGDVTVLTTAHDDAAAFDAAQPFRVVRTAHKMLLPTPQLVRQIEALADEVGVSLIVLDPALPVGLVGLRLRRPYVVVVHGSELVGRLPGAGSMLMGRVVAGAAHVVAAGNYPASEARRVAGDRTPPITVIPPGVDGERFRPLSGSERVEARRDLAGIEGDGPLIVALSRLVPRKGFDVLIDAVADLRATHPDVELVVGGTGRDHGRLQKRIDERRAPARLLGRVHDDDLSRLYGAAEVFAMCCRTRWLGLEPEGFGIVFLEAAACGVPQLAGDSGGAADAVVDGVTGLIVRHPRDVTEVARALATLLDDAGRREAMGAAGCRRATEDFTYDGLAKTLSTTLDAVAGA